MNEKFAKYIDDLALESGASNNLIKEVQNQLGVILPAEYIEFVIDSNGAEGPIGSSEYLQLWPIQELASLNEEYKVQTFAPGLLLFGSSGGGMAYAFDRRVEEMPIVEVPFIPLRLKNIKVVSSTFVGFLEYLYNQIYD